MINKFTILKPYGNIDWEEEQFSHIAEIKNPVCQTEEEIIEAITGVDLLIADVDIKVTEGIIEAANKLKSVVCASAGTDFVDLTAANRSRVVVTSIPDYCTEAVAEYTVALMFSISRHVFAGAKAALEGNWEKRREMKGVELGGKALGVVGFGKIGASVADKASALGMKVSVFSPSVSEKIISEKGFEKKETLTDLIKSSDIVSIHTSLRRETEGMFGEKEFKAMKPTGYLINVARGGILDENALYRALKEKWIAGAAVDVLIKEPPDKNNRLFERENIIITPHNAWNTEEATSRAKNQLKQIITQIINNQFPINVVNPEVKAEWVSRWS